VWKDGAMADLYAHTNVENTSLRILREKGYALRHYYDLDKAEMIIPDSQLWEAEKNGCNLLAHTPMELLGLAYIYEYHGEPPGDQLEPYWWVVHGEDIHDELRETAQPFGNVVDQDGTDE
jgi:hypothetical protein